jgi:hypothetical protein
LTYWIDTNVFVQCKDRIYPFNSDPEFWKFLSVHFDKKLIRSSEFIYRELIAGRDWLATWVRNRKATVLNTSADESVQKCYKIITDFIESVPKYEVQWKNEFYRGADGWLIAHAMADEKGVVVTHETERETGKIKVQSVCVKMGVPCIDIYKLKDIFKYRARDYME